MKGNDNQFIEINICHDRSYNDNEDAVSSQEPFATNYIVPTMYVPIFKYVPVKLTENGNAIDISVSDA